MRKLAIAGTIAAALIVCTIGFETMESREKQYLERSMDLARIWNSATLYYGYWDQIGGTAKWDDAYEKAAADLVDCRTDFEYLGLLEEFLAVLQDGRAGVLDGAGMAEQSTGLQEKAVSLDWGVLPFGVESVEDKIIVSQRLNGSEIPLYAEITQIEGKAPFDYLEEEYGNRVGVQTAGGRRDLLASALRFAEAGKKLRVSYETAEGESRTASVSYKRENLGSLPDEAAKLQTVGELVYDGEYVQIYEMNQISCVKFLGLNGQAAVEEFKEQALPAIRESAGCILDLRGCIGGDSAVSGQILQYFSEEPLPSMMKSYSLKSGLEMYLAKQIENQIDGSQRYEGTELADRGAKMNSGQYFYWLPSGNAAFCESAQNDTFSESVQKVNEEELKEIEASCFQNTEPEGLEQTLEDWDDRKPCVVLIDKKTAGAESVWQQWQKKPTSC